MRHFAITEQFMGEECAAYHRTLKRELARFPDELQRYVRHCGLHDASLRGFELDLPRSELVLKFYSDIFPDDDDHSLSLPRGAGTLSLIYSAVARFEASTKSEFAVQQPVGPYYGDVDHDELTFLTIDL